MMYDVLAGEIVKPEYADMTDAEIAAALNAPGASTRRRVPIAELQARAMESGVYTALRVVVGNAQAPAELRAVAQTVLDLANARFADVDMDNASAVQMFGTLQQAGVITVQQAAQIGAGEVIDDQSGLAGADLSMTAEEFTDVFTWTINLLAALYAVEGGVVATDWPTRETVDGYGVRLAGPSNIG